MGIPLNIDWQQILLHLLNFIILAVGLYLILYKPVQKFMAKRKAYYEDMDKQAAEKTAKAEAMEQEYKQRLAEADAACEQLKIEESKKLVQEKQLMIQQAKEQADQIVAEAKDEARAEKEKIVAGARKEIGNMVVMATEKLIAKIHSPETDRALYEKFLSVTDEGTGKE